MTSLRGFIETNILDKLNDIEDGAKDNIVRGENPPSVGSAVADKLYIEEDSDDIVERVLLKTRRRNPFFDVTVADLGDNQRGYAAAGYDDVDTGGSSDYSNLGSILQFVNTVLDGEFERIGSSNDFGVGESLPSGLAYLNGVMYMVGQTNDWLYTVSTSTGIATRVGTATQFGISEATPQGLASIGNTLYMIGGGRDWLYTVDTSTGVATRVGTATSFGIGENQPTGLAAIGNTLYMTGFNREYLTRVNTSTGVATRIGSSTQFGVSESQPGGLAELNGVLYMIGSENEKLYTVDTSTGVATEVGDVNQFGLSEGTPTGLTAAGGRLYMIGFDNEFLTKTIGGLGRGWVVRFPTTTSEVESDDMLRLFPSSGADEVELTPNSDITDAIAFSSEVDVAQTTFSISVGDTESMALYKSDGTQLYEGSLEDVYRELDLKPLPIGT